MKNCVFRPVMVLAVVVLNACGGGGGSDNGGASTSRYQVGGSVAGLNGTVVLRNNGRDELTISRSGPFSFATRVKDGDTYAVTVTRQPSGQTCSVSTGSGTVSGGHVRNIVVTCSANGYTVGGTLSGLSGTVVLQDNNGDDLSISADGAFTFTTPVAYGSAYAVTVLTQPAGANCSVANGSGTMPAGNVTNVAVTCAASTHTIGGTMAGLHGNVVLQNNNGADHTVSVNGPYVFSTVAAWGSPYNVTVLGQPAGQVCSVSNGSGTVAGNVTDVDIACRWSSVWTWEGGSLLRNQAGLYGTKGVPGPGTSPGARRYAASRTDSSGTLWLFGGSGYDATGALGPLNDLWRFDGGQWTWVSGANLHSQSGAYGTQGVASPGNVPGARHDAAAWVDGAGKFWLFGGYGYDSAGTFGVLNDLWRFDGVQWTWVSGSDVVDQYAVPGTPGVAAAGNVPGARSGATGWTGNNGTLWLFGGTGFDSVGDWGELDDLWKFDGTLWTFVKGSGAVNQLGHYGTRGLAEAGNRPGGRSRSSAWTDGSGNFWLFGGWGTDTFGSIGDFNDLWKFDGTDWTWVSGKTYVSHPGVYGTKGVAAEANLPGAREAAVAWIDALGNLWISGGWVLDAGFWRNRNDTWRFDGSQWTWMSGSAAFNEVGIYGAQGEPSAANVPGARAGGVSWIDGSGKLWMFGGSGFDAYGNRGDLNDLWSFQP